MKYICALVVVEDIQKSRYLYETILGQTVKADYGENVVFEGDFAIHQRAHFQKLIDQAAIAKRSNNFELYFEDDTLEVLIGRLKEAGLTFVHEIREQPWRQRVIRFYDYDGNIIEIGESLEAVARRLSRENLSIEEICKLTYLPVEKVRRAIRQE